LIPYTLITSRIIPILFRIFYINEVGSGASIHPPIRVHTQLKLGKNSFINSSANIGYSHPVIIGNDVSIGPGLYIFTGIHDYQDDTVSKRAGRISGNPVIIEDGVWIGGRVTILSGITIKENSIVAAGSVVTKDVDANVVVGGNPAKVIKVI